MVQYQDVSMQATRMLCILMLVVSVVSTEVPNGKSYAAETDPEPDQHDEVRPMKISSGGRSKRALDDSLKQQILDKHNELRNSEGSSSMKKMRWNDKLEQIARLWAEVCRYQRGQPLGSEETYDDIGQNIMYTSKGTWTVEKAMGDWFAEKVNYNLDSNFCAGGECSQYTQLVWGKSFELGCWMTQCENLIDENGANLGANDYFVCNYGPAGNFEGARPYFKGPACTQCPDFHYACLDGLCSHETLENCPDCKCAADCLNGGQPNAGCTCDCAEGWRGQTCEEPCVDDPIMCAGMTYLDCPGLGEMCPGICCFCVPIEGASGECLSQGIQAPESQPFQGMFDALRHQILDLHNELRKSEGSSSMKRMRWNSQLEESARLAAEGCFVGLGQPADVESPYDKVGQNTMYSSAGTLTVEKGLELWKGEKENYDLDRNHCSGVCGHYTQVVWDQSFELGCWMAQCNNLINENFENIGPYDYFVCNYGPAGNFEGARPYRKGPACTQCPDFHYACLDGLCSHEPLRNCPDCTCEALCSNGGKANAGCTCDCAEGWRGETCEVPCQDDPYLCEGKTYWDCDELGELCPGRCCFCVPHGGVSDECLSNTAREISQESSNESSGDSGVEESSGKAPEEKVVFGSMSRNNTGAIEDSRAGRISGSLIIVLFSLIVWI